MSDSWIAGNLESTLEMWNEKLAELWQLLTQSPATFKGGAIWNVMVNIHGALQALAYALMVLFFVVGVMKTCGSFADLKRPEHAVKLFVRFAITKMVITGGLELMHAILSIWLQRRSTRTACGHARFRQQFHVGIHSLRHPLRGQRYCHGCLVADRQCGRRTLLELVRL